MCWKRTAFCWNKNCFPALSGVADGMLSSSPGAAVHLPEDELSSEALAGKILGLMGSKDALSGMQQRLRTLLPAQPATEQVAAEVLRFSCT